MKTILVPVDFSPVSKAVVAEATALSRLCNGRIVLVHVVQPPVFVPEYGGMIENIVPLIEQTDKAAARLLAALKKSPELRGIKVRTLQLDGHPASAILRTAREAGADFIVMGSHGHTAFYDLLIGGTTSGVLKKAACPVLVVPARVRVRRMKSPTLRPPNDS